MKKIKAVSALLVTFTALLPFKEANAQFGSSYVLPPSAPSNTQILPCSYGDGSQCGFGQEGESEQIQQQPRYTGGTYLKVLRNMAYKPRDRGKMQRTFCGNNRRPTIRGYRFSSYEMTLVRQDLGC